MNSWWNELTHNTLSHFNLWLIIYIYLMQSIAGLLSSIFNWEMYVLLVDVSFFFPSKKALVNILFLLQLNYVLNTIFSLHMVIAFLVAVILDNTVPGSKQERGVYVWSEPEVARREPAVVSDYGLPLRVGRLFGWVKWVGLWIMAVLLADHFQYRNVVDFQGITPV